MLSVPMPSDSSPYSSVAVNGIRFPQARDALQWLDRQKHVGQRQRELSLWSVERVTLPTTPFPERAPWALVIGREPLCEL